MASKKLQGTFSAEEEKKKKKQEEFRTYINSLGNRNLKNQMTGNAGIRNQMAGRKVLKNQLTGNNGADTVYGGNTTRRTDAAPGRKAPSWITEGRGLHGLAEDLKDPKKAAELTKDQSFRAQSFRQQLTTPGTKLNTMVMNPSLYRQQEAQRKYDEFIKTMQGASGSVSDEELGRFLGGQTKEVSDALSEKGGRDILRRQIRGKQAGLFNSFGDYSLMDNAGLQAEKDRITKAQEETRKELERLQGLMPGGEGFSRTSEEHAGDLLRSLYGDEEWLRQAENEWNIKNGQDWDEATDTGYTQEQKDNAEKALEDMGWYDKQAEVQKYVESQSVLNRNGNAQVDNRESVYDAVNGYGAYREITSGMTDEEKAELDARIDEAIKGKQRIPVSDYQGQLEAGQARMRAGEADLKQIDYQMQMNDKYAALMASGTKEQLEKDIANEKRIMESYPMDSPEYQAAMERYVDLYGKLENWKDYDTSFNPDLDKGSLTMDTDGHTYGGSVHEIYSFLGGGKERQLLPGDIGITSDYGYAQMMSDDEVAKFMGYYNASPEDPKEAQAFMEALTPYLQQRYEQFNDLRIRDFSRRFPVMSTVAGRMATVAEPILGLYNIGDMVLGGGKNARNPYSWQYQPTNFKQKSQEQITKDAGDFGILYGAGVSSIDSALNAATAAGTGATGKTLEALTLGLFGMEAFQGSLNQNLRATNDFEKSVVKAGVDALIETATEVVSVEKLLSDPANFIQYLLKNAGAEASEEFVGSAFGPYIQRLLTGSDEWQEMSDRIISERGYTDDNGKWVDLGNLSDEELANEAKRRAMLKWNEEIFNSTVSGALSTGGGAVFGGARLVNNRIQMGRNVGRNAEGRTSSGIDSLITAAGTMAEGTESRKMAEEIRADREKGKDISSYRIGKLAETVYNEAGEKAAATTRDVLTQQIKDDLTGGGMESEKAGRTAELVSKAITEGGPQNLSRQERSELSGSAEGMNALRAYMTDSEKAEKARTEIAAQAGDVMAVRQTVADLVTDPRAKVSAASRDVADAIKTGRRNVASTAELVVASGKRSGSLDVVVDGQIRQVKGIRNGQLIVTDSKGNETTAEIGDAKMVSGTAAAAIQLATTRGDLISERYAGKMLETVASLKQKQEGAKALDDMIRIRLAAMSEGAMPRTMLDQAAAEALYNDAKAEYAENDRNRVVNQTAIKPGQGSAAFDGAEYGTAEYTEKMKGFSRRIRNQAGALGEIAVRAGFRVNFINDENNPDVYGWESAKDGTVTINLAAGGENGRHLLTIAGHEFTHWLEQNSREGYAALRSFILDRMRKDGKNVESMLTKLLDERGTENLDLSGAMAELVANACDQVLGSREVISALQKENPSLYNKARQFVKDFVARIREAVRGMDSSTTRESRAMMKYADELAELWLGAREEALGRETGAKTEDPAGMTDEQLEKRYAAAQEGYRFEKNLEKNLNLFAKNMQAFKKQFKADDVVVGETFQVLQDIGIDNKPMVINQKHLEQALVHPKDADHKMTVKQMMEIMAKANNPIAVIRSDSHSTNSIVEIVDYEINGNVVIVPIEISTSGLVNTIRIDTNRMSSAYGKKGIASMIAGAVNTELAGIEPGIYYINNKKTSFLRSRGLQLPDSSKNSGLVHKITDNKGFVKQTNTRKTETSAVMKKMYSAAQRDEEYMKAAEAGDTETLQRMVDEAAEEAFRKSKARTPDGKLMPVYHGTKADFNIFDTSVSGGVNGTQEGFGIYLTDDPKVTESYGNRRISGYVDMQRPAYGDRKTIRKAELAKLIKATCEAEARQMVEDGEYDTIKEAIQDTWISNYLYTPEYGSITAAYNAVADTILQQNDNDADIIYEVMGGQAIRNYSEAMDFYHNILTPTTGIDGIWQKWPDRITGREANILLAFDSSQIKEADPITRDDSGNIIPLSERFNRNNPDIRYSMAQVSQQDQEYADAVARGDMKRATEMLMDKLAHSENIIPFNAPNWYDGQHKDIAKLIKEGTPEAVARAAADMASYVPDNAVLVPMPPHEGFVYDDTDTKILADAIGELTGRPVVVALESDPRESRYKAKSEGRKGVRAEDMGFRQVAELPEGTIPIFIDNVVGSGETAKAALQAMGGGVTLSYAKSTMSRGIEGLKRAAVTYDKNGELIPLSQRFDASRQDIRYAMAQALENPVDSFSGNATVEARKDGLVAVHNLSERGLLADLRMGAFPMPSIAVVKQNAPWVDYGKISVFFGRDTVDPEAGNDIFGGDAFTPTLGAAQVSSADEALDVLRSKKRRDFSFASGLYDMMRTYRRIPDIETARKRAHYYGADGIEARQQAEKELDRLELEIWKKVKRNLADQLNMTGGQYQQNHMEFYISKGIMEAAEQIGIRSTNEKMTQDEKDRILENAVQRNLREAGAPTFELGAEGDEYDAIFNYIEYFDEHNGSSMQEAKPDRAVDFDEIQAILLPDNVSEELMRGLADVGIGMDRIRFYPAGSDVQRMRKMKEMPETIAGVSFSRAQADPEVNRWMLSLNEKQLNTQQEKNLLIQFKELRMAADIARLAVTEQENKIRKIMAKGSLTPFDREQIRKAENIRDNNRKKMDKLEADLIRVTSEKGYGALMMKQQRLINDLLAGKTAEDVQRTVDALTEKIAEIEKGMTARAEALRKMEEKAGVAAVKSWFAGTAIRPISEKLKADYGTTMSAAEIESRLSVISLKLMDNNMDVDSIMDDIDEMAAAIAGKAEGGYESYVIEALRGVYTLGEGQMKELKGQHRTLREVNRLLAGTGIRIEAYKPGRTTLDQVYGQLREQIATLDDVTEKDQLDAILDIVRREKEAAKAENQQAGYAESLRDDILVGALSVTGERGLEAGNEKQVRSLIKSIDEMREGANASAADLYEIRKQIRSIQKEGQEAAGGTWHLQNEIQDAMAYFNSLTEQSEAAIWKAERWKLIDQMKSEAAEALVREQEKWKQKIERDKTLRAMVTENVHTRNQITVVTKRMRKLLEQETDQKNIPEHMKSLAREVLRLIVGNDLAGNRKVTMTEKQALERTNQLLAIWEEREGRFRLSELDSYAERDIQEIVGDALADIEDGLAFYNASQGKDAVVNAQAIKNALGKIKEGVTTVMNIINAESSLFMDGKRISVEEAAYGIVEGMDRSRFKGEWGGRLGKALATMHKAIVSGNITPVYFFKNLRNDGMARQWREFERGEDRNGMELQKAKDFMERAAEATGYSTWDLEKRYDVSLSGYKARMTLEQMMALYATWQRESRLGPEMSNHLTYGGAYIDEGDGEGSVITRIMSKQRAHRMTKEDAAALAGMLTDDQKKYVDMVVGYLSREMSELGNEASMKMFGIEKYKESYYFPFQIWDGVKYARSDQGAGGVDDNRIAHQSFSKRRVNNARNALVIGNFTETATRHMVQMINYVTMAPAIENMNRVLNFQYENEEGTKQNVRSAFREGYGQEAEGYLNTLMKDINGGITQDPRRSLREKALSMFKKNAVAGSLSVALQQPLSYIRAAMMISPKYLAAGLNPTTWKGSYREMMEHSGVAVIKKMGKFDTGIGRSAQEYLMPERKTGRIKAVGQWIGEKSTILPELMDAATWTRMWCAVKAEQKALHPGMDTGSDQFMSIVSRRFGELMRRTQVYESTLVRSSNMRSQNYTMKALTSFMAEPTLSLNVLRDAVINVKEKGGKAMLARAAATFILSAVGQAIIKALMGAGRSPDDKKTLEENILNKFGYNLMNEANPFGLIPGYGDLITLMKDGELADDAMGAVGKLFSIITTAGKVASGKGKGLYRDIEDTVGQVAQLFTNVPVKNLMRDARAIANYIRPGTYAARETSGAVLKYQAADTLSGGDNLLGVINKWLGDAGYQEKNSAYYRRIYAAQRAGDTRAAEDMKEYLMLAKDVKESAINSEIRKLAKADESLSAAEKLDALMAEDMKDPQTFVVNEYVEGNIPSRAEAEKLYRKAKPDAADKDVMEAFDKADRKKAGQDTDGYTNYTPLREAIAENRTEPIRAAVKKLMDAGYKGKAIKDWIGRNYRQTYLNLKDGSQEKVKLRNAIQLVYKAAGYTAEDADKAIAGWNKEKKAGK